MKRFHMEGDSIGTPEEPLTDQEIAEALDVRKIRLKKASSEELHEANNIINDDHEAASFLTLSTKYELDRGIEYDSIICCQFKDETIGYVSFSEYASKTYQYSIYIKKKYRGKGFFKPIFAAAEKYLVEQLNARQILATIISCNEPSLKAHESVGFEQLHRIEELYYRNGAYHDEILMIKKVKS